MVNQTFIDFDLKTQLLSGDYIVGYKEDSSAEFKVTVDNLLKNTSSSNNTVLNSNSGIWDSTTSTVRSNSADWKHANRYLPLSGGTLTGSVTITAQLSATGIVYSEGSQVIKSDTTAVPTATAVKNIFMITQADYNALAVKDPYTIYFIV